MFRTPIQAGSECEKDAPVSQSRDPPVQLYNHFTFRIYGNVISTLSHKQYLKSNNHEKLEIDASRNSMSRTRDCRTGMILAPAGRSTALPPRQQYEGVSKSPRTMLITRKSLVVHEFPARMCCGGVLWVSVPSGVVGCGSV